MEADAAKLIGAGLAALGMAGPGIGLGILFGHYLSAGVRNPSAAPQMFGQMLLGFALTEAVAIYALLISLLLLFVV